MEPDKLLLQDTFDSGDLGISAVSLPPRQDEAEPRLLPTAPWSQSTSRAASQVNSQHVCRSPNLVLLYFILSIV